jgi:hypothetical protein
LPVAAGPALDSGFIHADFVQMLQSPHWLMLAGLSLVIAGCIGLALGRKSAAEIDDERMRPVKAALPNEACC